MDPLAAGCHTALRHRPPAQPPPRLSPRRRAGALLRHPACTAQHSTLSCGSEGSRAGRCQLINLRRGPHAAAAVRPGSDCHIAPQAAGREVLPLQPQESPASPRGPNHACTLPGCVSIHCRVCFILQRQSRRGREHRVEIRVHDLNMNTIGKPLPRHSTQNTVKTSCPVRGL